MKRVHYIDNYLINPQHPVTVNLIGAGGTGSQVLTGLARLDNQDMCELLGITKRTLARYRQKKLVTYYMIDGRTYYKSSEVKEFLNRKGRLSLAEMERNRINV